MEAPESMPSVHEALLNLSLLLRRHRTVAYRPIFLGQQAESVTFREQVVPIFISTTSHLSVKLTEQFDVFAKIKINSKGPHGRWAYFQEPPFLILGGVTYKFDFQY